MAIGAQLPPVEELGFNHHDVLGGWRSAGSFPLRRQAVTTSVVHCFALLLHGMGSEMSKPRKKEAKLSLW